LQSIWAGFAQLRFDPYAFTINPSLPTGVDAVELKGLFYGNYIFTLRWNVNTTHLSAAVATEHRRKVTERLVKVAPTLDYVDDLALRGCGFTVLCATDASIKNHDALFVSDPQLPLNSVTCLSNQKIEVSLVHCRQQSTYPLIVDA